MAKTSNEKAFYFGSALITLAAARQANAIVIDTKAVNLAVRMTSDEARVNALKLAMKPHPIDIGKAELVADTQPSLPAPASIELFDWQDLKHIDCYPSLAIMGKPGSGKTVLAEWLLYQLEASALVITTKRKVTQWRGLSVAGTPRNFEAITAALENAIALMQSRIAKLDADHAPLNIAIDELPAIALNIESLKDYLQPLILEARETRIRPIFLMHGDEVELIGVQGKGSLRKSITYIRLGNFAIDHARELVLKKRAEPQLLEWLKQQQRPCMVGDLPAPVPDLRVWQPNAALPPVAMGNSLPPVPAGEAGSDRPGLPELPESSESVVNRLNRLLDIDFQDSNLDSETANTAAKDTELRARIAELKATGMNQNQVIWAIWQAKPGGNKAYQSALANYKRLTSDT